MKITDYTAVYAAILATLGLIWNFVQWRKQKGKLTVKAAICKKHRTYTEEVEIKDWGDTLRVDIVNSGKSNLTLAEIGLKTGRPNPVCFWQRLPQARMVPSSNQTSLPHTLEPTKTVYWFLGETDVLLSFRTLKGFFIKDTHGKEWSISRRQLRRMRKIIKFEKNKRDASPH